MISVVMASYLGWYKGCASNRIEKFHRAVDSFLNQQVGELIIVSDGCDITIEESKRYGYPVQVYKIEKQTAFAGAVRQYGITMANFNWICYLDTDDEFLPGHLQSILDQISDELSWVYFDDIVENKYRTTELLPNKIGTSCIAHQKNINTIWPDGYGHDWKFINHLNNNCKKIKNAGYVVHHIKKVIDN